MSSTRKPLVFNDKTAEKIYHDLLQNPPKNLIDDPRYQELLGRYSDFSTEAYYVLIPLYMHLGEYELALRKVRAAEKIVGINFTYFLDHSIPVNMREEFLFSANMIDRLELLEINRITTLRDANHFGKIVIGNLSDELLVTSNNYDCLIAPSIENDIRALLDERFADFSRRLVTYVEAFVKDLLEYPKNTGHTFHATSHFYSATQTLGENIQEQVIKKITMHKPDPRICLSAVESFESLLKEFLTKLEEGHSKQYLGRFCAFFSMEAPASLEAVKAINFRKIICDGMFIAYRNQLQNSADHDLANFCNDKQNCVSLRHMDAMENEILQRAFNNNRGYLIAGLKNRYQSMYPERVKHFEKKVTTAYHTLLATRTDNELIALITLGHNPLDVAKEAIARVKIAPAKIELIDYVKNAVANMQSDSSWKAQWLTEIEHEAQSVLNISAATTASSMRYMR